MAEPVADRGLLQAVAELDVLDLAGEIIADPRRVRVSTVGQLALALAVERCWEVCLEAQLLVASLERAMQGDVFEVFAADGDVPRQMTAVRDLMAALRGNTST